MPWGTGEMVCDAMGEGEGERDQVLEVIIPHWCNASLAVCSSTTVILFFANNFFALLTFVFTMLTFILLCLHFFHKTRIFI